MSRFDSDEPTLAEVIDVGVRARLGQVRTSAIGIVQSYSATEGTATIGLPVRRAYRDENGVRQLETMATLVKVPVCFPGSGGVCFSWPLNPGETGTVLFLERDHDAWLERGGPSADPGDVRRHHESDAVFLPGIRSGAGAPADGYSIGPPTIALPPAVALRIGTQAGMIPLALATIVEAILDDFVDKYNDHVHTAPAGGGATTTSSEQVDSIVPTAFNSARVWVDS